MPIALAQTLAGSATVPMTSGQARATLTLFLVVAFSFNILPPNFFYDGITPPGAEGTPFNQIFWLGVLAVSITTFADSPQAARSVFMLAAPLLLLCVLLVASSAWSLAPVITLRRAGLQLIVVGSVLVNVAALRRAEDVFHIVYRVAALALLLEAIMLFRDNGFDDAGLFRGIHSHKNVIGYLAATSIFTGVWIRYYGAATRRGWNALYVACWVVALVLSQSKTSLALTLAAPALALGLWRFARATGAGLGITLAGLFGLGYSVAALAYMWGVDLQGEAERWVHHIGFTGRDEIWDFLIARYLEHPWLGHGYGGFWDIGESSPNLLYGRGFVREINQAHDGYLDLLLGLGLSGLVVYAGVLIGYLACLIYSERTAAPQGLVALCWTLVVFSLLHNFTETSLLRGFAWVWVLQLIALSVTYRLMHDAQLPT